MYYNTIEILLGCNHIEMNAPPPSQYSWITEVILSMKLDASFQFVELQSFILYLSI